MSGDASSKLFASASTRVIACSSAGGGLRLAWPQATYTPSIGAYDGNSSAVFDAHVKQAMRDMLVDHGEYIREYGDDMPVIRDWRWPA